MFEFEAITVLSTFGKKQRPTLKELLVCATTGQRVFFMV